MAIGNPHTSIITLNVNGLNSPIKSHRVANWVKKQNPTICHLWETPPSYKGKHRLKVKGWKMILQANGIKRKMCIAIPISDKIDFKIKNVMRQKMDIL